MVKAKIFFSLQPTEGRHSNAFRSKTERRNYWLLLTGLVFLGGLMTFGLMVYNNPVPIDSPSFLPVVHRRMFAVIAMLLAATCQSFATVAFQSVTTNRIITPSILGFESLYTTIHTSTIFFLGADALIGFKGTSAFFVQLAVMMGLSLLLYGSLLSGKHMNLPLMLLVGIVIGTGLGTLSSFMRRLLSPSDFDILQARLFGSVNNADPAYFPIVIPIVCVAALLLFVYSRRLNVLSLGKEVATAFGINYQWSLIYVLLLVSILMSISTALVGPLTFYGFLVVTLAYLAVPTYDHRYLFPMAWAISFVTITSAYFVMNHIFHAQGVVSVIIELVGGLIFLFVILRKRTL